MYRIWAFDFAVGEILIVDATLIKTHKLAIGLGLVRL